MEIRVRVVRIGCALCSARKTGARVNVGQNDEVSVCAADARALFDHVLTLVRVE